MTDIVERLRNVHRDWDPRLTVLLEAADRIEQLRTALQLIDKHLMLSCDNGAPGMLDVARAALGKNTP